MTVVPSSLSMRGKVFHNLLVDQAAGVFRDHWFSAEREKPLRLPDGRLDFLDILAVRGPLTVGCEIETTPRYVRVNADKARALGLPLFIVVPARRLRKHVRKLLNNHFAGAASDRIWILLPDELGQALANCFPVSRSANRPLEKERERPFIEQENER